MNSDVHCWKLVFLLTGAIIKHDGSNSTTKLDGTPINFLDKYYFFPIPLAAVTNNPNLQQNNKWDGTFDPVK